MWSLFKGWEGILPRTSYERCSGCLLKTPTLHRLYFTKGMMPGWQLSQPVVEIRSPLWQPQLAHRTFFSLSPHRTLLILTPTSLLLRNKPVMAAVVTRWFRVTWSPKVTSGERMAHRVDLGERVRCSLEGWRYHKLRQTPFLNILINNRCVCLTVHFSIYLSQITYWHVD